MQPNECARALLEVIPKAMHSIRLEMRECAKSELTVPQFRILIRLVKSSSTNLELAEEIGVRPSTMTRMIDPLVKRKLIVRNTRVEDRRCIEVSLTQSGRELIEEVQRMMRANLAERLTELNSTQRTVLMNGLAVIKELLIQ